MITRGTPISGNLYILRDEHQSQLFGRNFEVLDPEQSTCEHGDVPGLLSRLLANGVGSGGAPLGSQGDWKLELVYGNSLDIGIFMRGMMTNHVILFGFLKIFRNPFAVQVLAALMSLVVYSVFQQAWLSPSRMRAGWKIGETCHA